MKFWLVFVLAVIAAAVIWKTFGAGEHDAPPGERALFTRPAARGPDGDRKQAV